jgi:hypothetical protein
VPRAVKFKIGEKLNLRADPSQTHIFGEDGKAVRA